MDPGTKIWSGSKKPSICGEFLLNYDANNSRVIFCMSDSFHTSLGDFYDLRHAYL